jgi:hypothetical protein
MKTRNGFVSNSSTSSFICNVCGAVEAGRDLCLSDVEMVECQHGHTFHIDCVEFSEEGKKILEDDEDGDKRYEFPEIHCPVCRLEKAPDDDVMDYLLLKVGQSRIEIVQEMKEKYGTMGKFYEVLKTLKVRK